MKLKWILNQQSGSSEILPGENRIIVSVRKGEILEPVKGELNISPAQRMFFNGYQTWTHSPEFHPGDRIRGVMPLPKLGRRILALDHFADYHFVDYPNKKGILHGFSYCYFRDGEHYRLLASLDERPGYTMFTYRTETGTLSLERDCKGIAASGGSFPAFELFYAEGNENEVFDRWFDAMNIHNKVPKIKGYSSWYNHYQNINEQKISDDLNGARKLFDPGDLFQIDDGWEPFVGDWEKTDTKKFPHGLQPIVREIHDAGFKAGLWLAPFVCQKKSAIFREHPDWLLTYQKKPWKNGPNWGGFFSLDIDNPEFRAYLTRVFRRIFDEWNFDLVKLDFLYAAAPFATGDHGEAEDMAFKESRAARMVRALTFLRELCGKKLILGCGVPVMPAFGLVDYCRVGCDVGLDWDDLLFMRLTHRERISTRQSINNTIYRRALNGRAYGSDPDVFFLRDKNIRLSEKEKLYHAAVNALFGSVWLTSDDLNSYDETKISQYKQLSQLREATNIRVDPNTLSVRYTLDGKEHVLSHPHQ